MPLINGNNAIDNQYEKYYIVLNIIHVCIYWLNKTPLVKRSFVLYLPAKGLLNGSNSVIDGLVCILSSLDASVRAMFSFVY